MHETETGQDRETLAKAFDVQHRASLVGFDWSEPGGALEKVREETEEVAALIGRAGDGGGGEPGGDPGAGMGTGWGGGRESRVAEEVGDLLFAVVNLARLASVDPAAALSRATAKFEGRFQEVRRLAEERGLPMPGTPLGPLDRLWDEVKGQEKGRQDF